MRLIICLLIFSVVDNKPILSVFQLMLLEHIVMCRLVMGNKSVALAEISQACQLCRRQSRLLQGHRPQLHALLGLYAMSMNCMEAAEAQFTAALRVIFCFPYFFFSFHRVLDKFTSRDAKIFIPSC